MKNMLSNGRAIASGFKSKAMRWFAYGCACRSGVTGHPLYNPAGVIPAVVLPAFRFNRFHRQRLRHLVPYAMCINPFLVSLGTKVVLLDYPTSSGVLR